MARSLRSLLGLSLFACTAAGCAVDATAPDAPEESVAQIESGATTVGASPAIVPGTTAGKFAADAHGAATYAIPIAVPPGTAGMQPSLTLQYSSQSGYGIAGYGWSVTGLSTISRCPKTIAQDIWPGTIRYDANDAFCLDGQRLVYVNTGTEFGVTYWEYRTEIESFARIRAYATASSAPQKVRHNPEWWQVSTRAGQVMTYGGPNDARIEAQNSTNVRAWGVNKAIDAKGNYLKVSYSENNATGEAFPTQIAYTGNDSVAGQKADNQVVKFTYEARTDVSKAYLSGDAVQTSQRLSKVQTYVAGALAREYRLGYESAGNSRRSRLISVQECTTDGTAGSCYPATRFTYGSSGASLTPSAVTWGTGHNPDEQTGDFNGDGIADLVDIRSGSAYISLGSKTGLGTASPWKGGFASKKEAIKTVDVNADGKTDLIQFDSAGNVLTWVSTGTTFNPPVSGGVGFSSDASRNNVADVNGDGRPDLIVHYGDGTIRWAAGNSTGFGSPQAWLSGISDPKSVRFGDFNGDGRMDVAILGSDVRVYLAGEAVASPFNGTWASGMPVGQADGNSDFHALDVNGDHRDDLIQLGAGGKARAWLSTGRGFVALAASGAGIKPTDALADVDADGFADIVQISDAYVVSVAFGNGSTFSSFQKWGALAAPGVKSLALASGSIVCDSDVVTDLQKACGDAGYDHVQPGTGTFTCAPLTTPSFTVGAVPSSLTGSYAVKSIAAPNANTLAFTYQSCTFNEATGQVCTNATQNVTVAGSTVSLSGSVNNPSNIAINGSTITFGNGLGQKLNITFSGLAGISYNGAAGASVNAAILKSVTGSGSNLTFNFGSYGTGTMTLVANQYAKSVQCVEKTGLRFADFNGDGRSDALLFSAGAAKLYAERAGVEADLLKQVDNGLTHRTSISYAPLTDRNVYNIAGWTRPATTYPLAEVIDGMLLVSRVDESNGIGGMKATTFAYARGLTDARGRGFLGFEMVQHTTLNSDGTAALQRSTYRTDFPFTGIASRTQGYLGINCRPTCSSWRLLNDKSSTLASLSAATLAGGKAVAGEPTRYFPYELTVTTSGSDMAGVALPTTTVTKTFDPTWGVLTKMETNTPAYGGAAGLTITAENELVPANTADWITDRIRKTTVTKKTTDGKTSTRSTAFEYDADGLLKKETIAVASRTKVTTYGYDAWGNKNYIGSNASDEGVREVSLTYDAQGRFATTGTNALGHATTTKYDPRFGAPTEVTDPNSLITKTTYDGFGRKTSETRPTTVQGTVAYAAASGVPNAKLMVTATTPGAPTEVTYLDCLGREVRKTKQGFDGRVVVEDTEYNAEGLVSRKSLPYFTGTTPYYTRTTYDSVGRPTTIQFPDGSQLTTSYRGLSETGTNDKGQSVTRTKNAQGHVISVVDAKGTTSFTFDADGNAATVTDSASNRTTLGYDDLGQKNRIVDPDMGESTFKINGYGETVEQVSPRHKAAAQKIVMDYDALGRMVSRKEGGETSTWTYDTCKKGLLCSVRKVNDATKAVIYSETLTYNALTQVTQRAITIDGATYTIATTYDTKGRPETITYPGSALVVKNVYNAYGYLASVQNSAGTTVYWKANEANAQGQIIAEKLGNGLITRRGYDPQTGNLETIQTAPTDPATLSQAASTWVQRLSIGWDKIGNVTSRSDTQTGFAEEFQYDELSRLTAANVTLFKGAAPKTGVAPANLTLTYDALGNIRTKSDVGTYGYATTPHAVSTAGPYSYKYDANGNMTSGAGRTITWTLFDKPQRIDMTGGAFSEFTYGPDHDRIKQRSNVETTIYVSPLFEKVTRGSSVINRHTVFAGNEPVAFVNRTDASKVDTRYPLHDHLGSPVGITDEGGALIESFSYDAFGKRRLPDGSRITEVTFAPTTAYTRGYTGHEMLDNLGIVHMNGRIYDPVLGRFMSADPLVQQPDFSQSYNRYSYVTNNPLSATDPSGHLFGFLKKLFKKIWKVLKVVLRIIAVVLAIAIAIVTQQYWALLTLGEVMALGAIGGALLGYGLSGTLKAAFMGAITGAVGGAIGFKLPAGSVGNIAAHGVSGGVMNVVQGGDFKSGFISGAFSAFAAPLVDAKVSNIGNDFVEAAVGMAGSAVVGGVSAELGGGKFANGAKSAAINYLFNDFIDKLRNNAKALKIAERYAPQWLNPVHDPIAMARFPGMTGMGGGMRVEAGVARVYNIGEGGHFMIEVHDMHGNSLMTHRMEDFVEPAEFQYIREIQADGFGYTDKIFHLRDVGGSFNKQLELWATNGPGTFFHRIRDCAQHCGIVINAGDPIVRVPTWGSKFEAGWHRY